MNRTRVLLGFGLLIVIAVGALVQAAEPATPVPSATVSTSTAAPQPQVASGFVYHDVNGNGYRDNNEPGVPDIRVSNGRDIVETDERGRYELAVDDDTILFVIKPRGWRTPLTKAMLPRFYYIHKPAGSPPDFQYPGVPPTGPLPDSIDFALYRQQEPDSFSAIMFGDPQPRDQKEIDYIAHDVVEGLIGTHAAFGVTLGDIVFDDLSLFESQARTIGLIGIPWYNVIGNHDVNQDAPHDGLSNETFQRHFGPAYYSFDYGPAHFVVLDNVEWYISKEDGQGRYRGGLGEDQIAFLREDLRRVPDDQLVVLMMHIQLNDMRDRQQVYRLIENRPFCISISGHMHYHQHRFITRSDGWRGPEPHHHIVNVTVCGSFWSGAPDERGIPHATMGDGTPNGYSILSFDGTDYRLDFQAAGRSPDHQMLVYAPEAVAQDDTSQSDVFVNFFNGSERAKVDLRIADSPWLRMNHVRQSDPGYLAVYEAERIANHNQWRPLPEPNTFADLWQIKLPADLEVGTHALQVSATDMYGRVFNSRRVIRITRPE